MPEGDTVFLAGRRLADALSGELLVRGEIRHPSLSTVDLSGLTVDGVRSVGKHLFVRFDDGRSLHSHFRMDGSWHLYRPGERWRGAGHDVRAVLTTAERVAVGFRLHDLALLATSAEAELVGHLGPDLLGPDWGPGDAAEAALRLASRGDQAIGEALLDQRVMAGVGNLYKSEVCFLLGVSPWAPVSSVEAGSVVALCRELLLRNAWRVEQSTTGELGRGRQQFVYQRTGRPCLRCGTAVRVETQGSETRERGTWFCPHCQSGPFPGSG
jgi:endonuclease-8